MDSPCIKQTVCKVLKIFQYGKYLVAYVLNDNWLINDGRKYCRMLPLEHSGILLTCIKARIFLLVDLREKNFRLRVGGTKKNKYKSSENDQLTGHFQSFFFVVVIFRAFFSFNISRKNSKTSKANQQSVLIF